VTGLTGIPLALTLPAGNIVHLGAAVPVLSAQDATGRLSPDTAGRSGPLRHAPVEHSGGRDPTMNIVVCVKYVPDAQADRTFEDADHTTDRVGVDGRLSELDEYAVEEALKIVEASGVDGDQVTVLTVGPEQAGEAVKKSLQMGAHAGVHVSDEAIAGSDAAATSLVLAKAIEKLGAQSPVDLVLTGMASTDASMSVVPAMLAERLGLPQVTYASEVTVSGGGSGDASGGSVRIRRDGDASTQTIEASLPAVVSVTDQINEPRYPSFKGIMAAKKKPVQSWGIADLGIDAGQVGLAAAWTSVETVTARPPREAGQVVKDEGDGGAKLAEFLVSRKFV
jgi:electron transfer flavoprotein beta subunit